MGIFNGNILRNTTADDVSVQLGDICPKTVRRQIVAIEFSRRRTKFIVFGTVQ